MLQDFASKRPDGDPFYWASQDDQGVTFKQALDRLNWKGMSVDMVLSSLRVCPRQYTSRMPSTSRNSSDLAPSAQMPAAEMTFVRGVYTKFLDFQRDELKGLCLVCTQAGRLEAAVKCCVAEHE